VLVAERGAAHPERIEEWGFYVTFLAQHAGADGRLPPTFDYLIEDAFRELL
jgi:hypothetical protein